jgi:mannose-6-phosphate isomerase-like protein (cupin superfamily)
MMEYVLTPDDLDWTEIDKPGFPNTGFLFTPSVIDKDFTEVYSAQLGRIRPGKGSTPHRDPYNHAFYFMRGSGKVRIGRKEWDLRPGTIVKIPAGKAHGFTNTGPDDLVFLVIYDPPYLAGTEFKQPAASGAR